MPFRHLLSNQSSLTSDDVLRLGELTAEWQLLADISFADLVLWIPKRKDEKSWPEGHRTIAQIRPMTAATVFTQDLIGNEVAWGSRPDIDQALSSGEIVRDSRAEQVGEIKIKIECIPVFFAGRVIAVISRHRNLETMRTPSRLELNYREIANHIYRMIAEGNFPVKDNVYLAEAAPRVGDGLVRLNVGGEVLFASPNARSAFNRIGWDKDLEGQNFGQVLDSLVSPSSPLNPREENWQITMSGKQLRRDEFENSGGVLDLLAMPLTEGDNRIGAVVLVHNVTELRRKDRALISKDATIREIHHRVKNNLQTVSALLRLQSRRIEDPAASAALNEAVRRIASIALVHETLSSSTEASVAFDDVLDRLVTHALELSPRMGELNISRHGELGSLDPRIATPLSLVVTELIHNALEHGLAESGANLTIEVSRLEGSAEIVIFDDGVGLPDGFTILESANLGLQIVRTLTENELKGSIDLIRTNRGTEAKLNFPI